MIKTKQAISSILKQLSKADQMRRYVDPKTSKIKELENVLQHLGICDENGVFNTGVDPEVQELISYHFPG